MKMKLISGAVAVISILILFVGFSGLTSIEPGEVGVLVKNWGGNRGMQPNTLNTGMHWVNPWVYDAIVYDTRIRQYPLEDVQAQTGDGQPIDLDLTINVGLVDKNVPILHERIGPSYYERIILPVVDASIKNRTATQLSDRVYTGAGRLAIQEGIEEDLRTALQEYGISASVNLQDVRFQNPEFVRILEQKAGAAQQEEINRRNAIAAEQEAIRVENVARGQRLKTIQEAEAEKERLRLIGEGNQLRDEATARGNLALASAEAEGLRLKNEALSGRGAQYIASMEWARYMGPNVKVYGAPVGAPGTNTYIFDQALRDLSIPVAAGAAAGANAR